MPTLAAVEEAGLGALCLRAPGSVVSELRARKALRQTDDKAVFRMGLWGKKAEAAAAPRAPETTRTAGEPTAKETSMALTKRDEDAMTKGNQMTLLNQGSEFEGKLTFEGEVHIGGRFTGEIFSKDSLHVEQGARVHAEITVGSLIIFGEVTGNIKASQLVELKANAKVKGNIETPTFTIERGALFEGACKMENLGKGASVTPLKQAEEKK